MTHDKNALRKILDRVKTVKHDALTAPEPRGVRGAKYKWARGAGLIPAA
jgi:hypothetical protein